MVQVHGFTVQEPRTHLPYEATYEARETLSASYPFLCISADAL